MNEIHRVIYDSERHPNPGRVASLCAYDPVGRQIVFHGGTAGPAAPVEYPGDTWHYSPVKNLWTQRQPLQSIGVRTNTPLVYDPARMLMYCHGGWNGTVGVDELWTYDPASSEWDQLSPASSPGALSNHSMSYDSDRARHVLFGGGDASFTVKADLWEYDSAAGTWAMITPDTTGIYAATPPVARLNHRSAYDPVRKLTVILGGLADDFSSFIKETWLWDGIGWRLQPSVLHPEGDQLEEHCLQYVAALGGVVCYGGDRFNPSRTWLLTDTGWTELFPTTPPDNRNSAGCATDGKSLYVIHGQFEGEFEETTLRLSGTPDQCDWENVRSGFRLTDPATGRVTLAIEMVGGLRFAGSPPYETGKVYRAIDESGFRADAIQSVQVTETNPPFTETRWTIQVDGVEWFWDAFAATPLWRPSTGSSSTETMNTNSMVAQITGLPMSPGDRIHLVAYPKTTDEDVTPEADQVEFVIAPSAPEICVVSGRLLDSGSPVAGAAVRVRPTVDGLAGADFVAAIRDEAFSDSDGVWSLSLYETATRGLTVDLEISYTGPSGLVTESYTAVEIPNVPTADFDEIVSP